MEMQGVPGAGLVKRKLSSYCPGYPSCKTDTNVRPTLLSDSPIKRIQEQIRASGDEPLPELEEGEKFYYCSRYCEAVWKAGSFESSPRATILGYWNGVTWKPK